jgi:predicted adenylyl cyclase CyaB
VGFINVEIKARCGNPQEIERILLENNADYIGMDNQTDTYFKVVSGRLKLREGNIENALIYYNRDNIAGPKLSNVLLYTAEPKSNLKQILEKSVGILTTVEKKRKIFFIGHVKFHIDDVKNLGNFIEIEAIDKKGTIGKEQLQIDCNRYLNKLKIKSGDLEPLSYSDLLIKRLF